MNQKCDTQAISTPPRLSDDVALFLDFDGTLTEFALAPDHVNVSRDLLGLLLSLRTRLDGALAIVTGRLLSDIDRILAPVTLAGAGLHGAELRIGYDETSYMPDVIAAPAIATALREHFAADPRIVIEDKGPAVALHYRQAPELAAECLLVMKDLVACCGELELILGSMVVEARPRGRDKGIALRTLMTHQPFRGRIPVFVGDDATDEDGFRAVQSMGGFGVKVNAGKSNARYRCYSVAEVHGWLRESLPRVH